MLQYQQPHIPTELPPNVVSGNSSILPQHSGDSCRMQERLEVREFIRLSLRPNKNSSRKIVFPRRWIPQIFIFFIFSGTCIETKLISTIFGIAAPSFAPPGKAILSCRTKQGTSPESWGFIITKLR